MEWLNVNTSILTSVIIDYTGKKTMHQPPNQIQNFFENTFYKMVNTSNKPITTRIAIAQGTIRISKQTFLHIQENTVPKGNPLVLAEITGILGAKKTHELIPLCHPLALEQVIIQTECIPDQHAITVYCLALASAKTGVEMEALSGVQSALLAIYDICKQIDPVIELSGIKLLFKQGGKHSPWIHPDGLPAFMQQILTQHTSIFNNLPIAIVTLSQRAFKQEYADRTGALLKTQLSNLGAKIIDYKIIPDNSNQLIEYLKKLILNKAPQLILTNGGTGIAPMDITTESIKNMCDKIIPGIGEALRQEGAKYTPYSWLSNCLAGIYKKTLIICLPGSPNAIQETLPLLKNLIPHALNILNANCTA